ncbi:helix-turn-helix domain-containing protein [Leptolyngbya sp. DQ-M1]|uniref:helix-turn-helix domain-containing protein n=1 Tax=Leptolyngbya sp. DQ-M1 TaxID=2933920 RepID=UPI00329849B6
MARQKKNAKSKETSAAAPQPSRTQKAKQKTKPTNAAERPKTSPDLFSDHHTTRMASALPIWEAGNILTQRKHLPWDNDPDGKLYYARDIGDGQGAIHFWVTENLEDEHPATLAGAAALAVIDTFDIRAACMHLIYAAHAAQLERPWEQELIIDDRQIEAYLGLKKRTDKNRREKLALIEELVKQPCKITTFISLPTQGRVKGFTVEEGRLWHIMGTRYHYQQDLFGNKELTGMTFIVKPGLWARYFLNEEGKRDRTAYHQLGNLPQTLLESVMSLWQHREGAARLIVWLLFKAQFNRQDPLNVQTLMEVAYGNQKIQQAKQSSEFRKKLASTWDEDLLTLHDRGWSIQFDLETYPLELQPPGFGRDEVQRPRGFFDRLLAAKLWITPAEDWQTEAISAAKLEEREESGSTIVIEDQRLTGQQVKLLRQAKKWSQRKLSQLSGMSQGLISLIENEERSISPENEQVLRQLFEQEM